MKKLTRREFGDIKGYLKLGEVIEVSKRWGLGLDTVNWVEASKNHKDYMDTYRLVLEQKQLNLRKETIRAQEIIYVMPEDLKRIIKILEDMQRDIIEVARAINETGNF